MFLSLPIIIYCEGELDVFCLQSSTTKNKRVEYKIDDRIYKIDDHEHIKAKFFRESLTVLDLSITKNVAFIILAFFIMVVVFGKMAKSYKYNSVPRGFGRFLEPIVLYIRDDIARPNIGEKHYKRYMSFLLTVFFLYGLLTFRFNPAWIKCN